LKNHSKIILASSSRFRSEILQKSGLNVSRETPKIDERALEAQCGKKSPSELALLLAMAKAEEVSQRFMNYSVIGCDQIMVCENHILHKVKDRQQAQKRLCFLSGKTHQLHTSISVYWAGKLLWQHQDEAFLTMRSLTEEFISTYLQKVGDGALATPGIYQIEGLGIQLFEKIRGDYHSIIGLPLLPLLNFLRS